MVHESLFSTLQGHMASDCPEPEVCRRCRKEGHVKVLSLMDVFKSIELIIIRMIALSLRSASTAAKKATVALIVLNRSSAESAGNQ